MVIRYAGLVAGVSLIVVGVFVGWVAALVSSVGVAMILVSLFSDDGSR